MMPFSESPRQRYTPPTCTLEIWRRRASLFRFRQSERAQSPELQFELRFDDPRLPSEQQVTVRGDLAKLNLLCEAIGSYLQTFLHQTLSPFNGSLPEVPDVNQNVSSLPSEPPSLRARGFLAHELDLGILGENASHPSVQLSSSQLFDLANALEDYQTEVSGSGSLRQTTHRKQVLWATIGAVSVLVTGLAIWGMKQFNLWPQLTQSLTSLNPSASQRKQPDSVGVIPPVPPPPNAPVQIPALPPSLANRETLPPPPAVSSGIPPTRQPSGAIQAPTLSVLPPPPVVPPAPPKPASATPSVISLPAPKGLTILPQPTSSTVPSVPSLAAPPPLRSPFPFPQTVTGGLRPSPSSFNEPLRDNANSQTTSLLDTIPQVAEARQYLQQRWQPPADLKQTLEYRLIVQPDGSLERAVPLGKIATLYLPQTGIPAPGQKFVSPLKQADNQTLRLVLESSGNVRTFLESY